MIEEIRFKLEMFEVPLARQVNVFCDNNGVVKNKIIPESTLSNNHNAINYQCVHESAASGIMHIRKEDTATNLDNPLTKLIPYSRNQYFFGSFFMAIKGDSSCGW